jgi:hypothetical protein
MKKTLLVILSAAVLGGFSSTGLAAEPTVAPPASQTVPATGAEKAGRFVTRFFDLAGSALQWTGKAAKGSAEGAGRAVTNLINSLKSQKAAKP